MDEPETTPHRHSKHKRAFLMTLPFLLLLLCLGGLNIWARSVLQPLPAPTPITSKPTPTQNETETSALSITETAVPTEKTPIATETPPQTPVPTATPIILPTLPPTATLTLLGPPDQSRFMATDTITIYWTWPLPLAGDQYFGIYLQEETGESRIGRLEEANFGTGYRWQTAAQTLSDNDGDDSSEVSYLIKLETTLSGNPLISSQPRTVFILKKP